MRAKFDKGSPSVKYLECNLSVKWIRQCVKDRYGFSDTCQGSSIQHDRKETTTLTTTMTTTVVLKLDLLIT